MPFCPNCGKEHGADAKFCAGCGKPIGGGAAAAAPAAAPAAAAAAAGGSVQITSSRTDPPIPKKDHDNLKEQLEHLARDRDRIRIVSAAADSFSFTTEQIVVLLECQHYGDAKNQTAILLYPKCTDQENFKEAVLAVFQFDEDKQEICDALGL